MDRGGSAIDRLRTNKFERDRRVVGVERAIERRFAGAGAKGERIAGVGGGRSVYFRRRNVGGGGARYIGI